MKTAAYVSLSLLALSFAGRALMLSYMCVCGSCGFIFSPWAVVFLGLTVAQWAVIWWISPKSNHGGRAMIVAILTLVFMLWSTGGYVAMIFRGEDYFDVWLFIPIL